MKDYFSYIFNKERVKLFFFDQFFLLLSIVASYFIRLIYSRGTFSPVVVEKIVVSYFIISPFIILFFYIMGVYERWETGNFSKAAVKIVLSIVFVSLFTGFIFYFIPHYLVGRFVFLLIFTILSLFLLSFRFFYFSRYEKIFKKRKIYFLGLTEREKRVIRSELSDNDIFDFVFIEDSKISDFLENVKNFTEEEDIIVFFIENSVVKENMEKIIEYKFMGYFIYEFENFYSGLTGKIYDISLKNVWRIVGERNYLTTILSYYRLKRMFDIIISFIILVLTAPFFILIPIIIKLSSKGPVFFIQERLGWYKKPFKLIKFRTMICGAERETGPKWAEKDDPRITKVGKFLRATRLDELPQLFNVLKGDMSLVGTRPIREYFAKNLRETMPFYDLRFFVKPGLTGWSQVKMGYINTVEQQIEKFKYELFYIRNMSFVLDFIILIKTIKVVLNFKGR